MLASQNRVKTAKNEYYLFSKFVLVLNSILILSFLCTRSFLFYFMFEASLIPTLILILG